MIDNIHAYTFPAAFALLPGAMDTPPARAMLLAIGLQESKFQHRRQVGGPAHGFWQFEQGGGVAGVLGHASTGALARAMCSEMIYTPDAAMVYDAISDNDVLACCFARLLLWTLPGLMAPRGAPSRAWDAYFARAWAIVEGDQ